MGLDGPLQRGSVWPSVKLCLHHTRTDELFLAVLFLLLDVMAREVDAVDRSTLVALDLYGRSRSRADPPEEAVTEVATQRVQHRLRLPAALLPGMLFHQHHP